MMGICFGHLRRDLRRPVMFDVMYQRLEFQMRVFGGCDTCADADTACG